MAFDIESSCLSSEIERAVAKFPSNVALVCDVFGELTYSDMSEQSDLIARELAACGIEPGDRVVICMKRTSAVVLAIVAILKLGACYVPVAQNTPKSRLARILKDCRPRATIFDAHSSPSNFESADGALLMIEPADAAISVSIERSSPRHDNELEKLASGTCSIIYTSGSTGNPKGVIITSANILHYIGWATEYFGMSSDDRVLGTAPFHFDMSTFDIFASLLAGAELNVASERDCLFPKLLVTKMMDRKITVWKGVSSLFGHVARLLSLESCSFPQLRTLIFSGESLPTRYLLHWMSMFPEIDYYNGYGPTETTGVSCCYRILRPMAETDPIPIGRPRAETSVRIVDGDEIVTEAHHTGELVIGGPGVTSGYWSDGQKTKESFVTRIGDQVFERPVYRTGDLGYYDDNRDIVFVSRVDRQIKHQGYRIELNDIESALFRIDGVVDAAVVHKAEEDRSEIVAFFDAPDSLEDDKVFSHLRSSLPAYMTPKTLVRLPGLPRNDRGKVDYAHLLSLC